MNVVILAGGLGTRLSEYTKKIPKPMVKINKIPIIIHIINHYAKFGLNNFYIAAGYKKNVITNYFKKKKMDLNIKVIDTGKKTMTGGRLKRLKKYLDNDTFMMTYGDGLANISIKNLIKFHYKNKSKITLTAVRPKQRYGVLKLNRNKVNYFDNTNKKSDVFINGGFFVISQDAINSIKNNKIYWEKEPLTHYLNLKKLFAYKHNGFWKSLDTQKDKDGFNYLFKKNRNKLPWKV